MLRRYVTRWLKRALTFSDEDDRHVALQHDLRVILILLLWWVSETWVVAVGLGGFETCPNVGDSKYGY